MPIDSSIYQHVVLPKWEMPSEVAARHLTLASIGQRQVMQTQAIRDHEMAYRQRMEKEQRAAAVRQMVAEARGDPDLILAGFWRLDPENAPEVERSISASKAAKQRAEREKYDFEQKVEDDIANGVASVAAEPNTAKRPNIWKSWYAGLTVKPYFQTPEGKGRLASISADMPADEEVTAMASKSPAVRLILENIQRGRTREAREAADARHKADEADATAPDPETGLTPYQQTQVDAEAARLAQAKVRDSRPRGTAGGTGALALRRIEDSEANRVKDEIDKKTKEFNRLTIETSKAWGKVNHTMTLRKKGAPYPKDEDDTTLAGLETERRENAEDLERQKNEYYDDLVKLGAKKPIGPTRRPAPPATVPGMERLGPRPGVPGAPIASDLRAAAPVAAPASRAPAAQTAKPQTYTEADVRKRAKARGLDENAAVSAARNAGLIR